MATGDNFPPLPSTEAIQGIASGLEAAEKAAESFGDKLKGIFDAANDTSVSFAEINKHIHEMSPLEAKRLKSAEKLTEQAKESVKTAKLYKLAQDASVKALQDQGKYMRAFVQESKDAVMVNGKMHMGKALGSAAKGVENIEQNVYSMLGPWGVLLKIIVDVIDGVRATRSEMVKASAATGDFANSYETANRESININKNQAELMWSTGMTKANVEDLAKALKGTGFKDFGSNVVSASGDVKAFALNVAGFAMGTGKSNEAVAGQMAVLRRSFMGVKAPLESLSKEYLHMYQQGKKWAQDGMGTMSEYIDTVFSLGDAFRDVGMNIRGVEAVLMSTGRAMTSLKFPAADVAKVTQQLLGMTKSAGEGWQVLAGRMSGMQGGFASTLHGMQQRGAGSKMPGQNEFDPKAFIQQMGGMMTKLTGGIGDQSTRQYMIEKVGGQMGLDAKSTEVLQELQAGTISSEEAAVRMGDINEAAKKARLDSQGMFEILKTILIGLVAKPIVMIYDFLTKIPGWLGGGKGSSSGMKKDLKKMSKGDGGLDILTGGLVEAHAKELMVNGQIVPVAKTRPFTDKANGSGGMNITNNISGLNEQSIREGFRQSENKTLGMFKQNNKALHGGR